MLMSYPLETDPDTGDLDSISRWTLPHLISDMPPYDQLIRDLTKLQKENPEFDETLQAVITYLKKTQQEYIRITLDHLPK